MLLKDERTGEIISELSEETFMFSAGQRKNLAIAVTCVYILLWVVYWTLRESLWQTSVDVSISLSKHGGLLLWYCWLFSEVVYKWYILIIGVLGVFAPRKDRMMTSVLIFIISYIFRQYIRLIIGETRPQYTTAEITMRGGCNCSYGMPSGHSEGTAMVYALLFYNIIPLKADNAAKVKMVVLYIFITASVAFSRVYYGRHSIPQVVLGAWQSVTAFCWMLVFEDATNAFFRRLLAGGKAELRLLLTFNASVLFLNLASWFLIFDRQISNLDLKSKTCFECFENGNLSVKHDLGKALIFPTIWLGMTIGYMIGGVRCEPYNPEYLSLHASWLGFKRIFLNLILYSPLVTVMGMKGEMLPIIVVGTILYIICGYMLSTVEIRLRHRFALNIPGDLSLEGLEK